MAHSDISVTRGLTLTEYANLVLRRAEGANVTREATDQIAQPSGLEGPKEFAKLLAAYHQELHETRAEMKALGRSLMSALNQMERDVSILSGRFTNVQDRLKFLEEASASSREEYETASQLLAERLQGAFVTAIRPVEKLGLDVYDAIAELNKLVAELGPQHKAYPAQPSKVTPTNSQPSKVSGATKKSGQTI